MALPITIFFLIVFHLFIPIHTFGSISSIFGTKTIECDFGGKKETRHIMDCNQDVDYQARAFSFKIDVLDKVKLEGSTEKRVLREVGQVLQILKLQNQQLCQRWNACAISREDFNRQSAWLLEVFTSFSMILENVKLSELDDPAIQKEFLREMMNWFKDTAEHAKNKRIEKIWDSIKTELDTLKEDVKDKAREGAKEGAAEAVAEVEKRFMHMLEGKLSPPIPNEKIQQEIDSLKASVEKERLEKASILVERGTERLDDKKYEKAILDFEDALKILPDDSKASISTYFNLGIALTECSTGDREANLNKAICSYNKILLSFEKEKYLFNYACVQNNLGIAYTDLSAVRDKEVNLGFAIKAYLEALKVYTPEKFSQDYAMTQGNLGNAYCGLSEVRNTETNLRLATKAYHEALKVITLEKFPHGYAMIQGNLGSAYGKLSEVRNTETNLELAIKACQEALRVFTFEKFPQDYAKIQGNLGNAYWSLSEVRNTETNLELAIKACQEALRVFTFEKFPQYYANTQGNLGNAYWSLSEVRNKENNLGLAIKAYQEALRVFTFEKFPQDYAMTQRNLGSIYCRFSELRNREANLWLAIKAYHETLKISTREFFPLYFIKDSYTLAKTLSLAGDFKKAIEVMDKMLPVAEKLHHPKVKQYRQFYASLKSSK